MSLSLPSFTLMTSFYQGTFWSIKELKKFLGEQFKLKNLGNQKQFQVFGDKGCTIKEGNIHITTQICTWNSWRNRVSGSKAILVPSGAKYATQWVWRRLHYWSLIIPLTNWETNILNHYQARFDSYNAYYKLVHGQASNTPSRWGTSSIEIHQANTRFKEFSRMLVN